MSGRDQDDDVVAFATTVGLGELELTVDDVVAGVVDTGCPAIVTQHGVPVAVVVALDPEA